MAGPFSNLTNIIVLVAMSSTVVSLPYDVDSIIPQHNYDYHYEDNISDWKDKAFNSSSDYQMHDESFVKIQTIIEFSKRVLANTKDIDSEYVDIVNDNFWDLI